MKHIFFLMLISIGLSAHGQNTNALAEAALLLTKDEVTYDPAYFSIPYPNGDVPASKGVCTDVVIRAYRKIGIDLQRLVHQDMKANFHLYPKYWGLKRTDTNIDHRRVPNLIVFFKRFGNSLPKSKNASDYKAGDIVCWQLPGNLYHIGLVSNKKSANGTPLIVHNIGAGQVLENMLFDFPVIGHYYYPLKLPNR